MEHLWSRAVAISGNRCQTRRRPDTPIQAKAVATGCDQLPARRHRKGSTVRVRQRASLNPRSWRFFVVWTAMTEHFLERKGVARQESSPLMDWRRWRRRVTHRRRRRSRVVRIRPAGRRFRPCASSQAPSKLLSGSPNCFRVASGCAVHRLLDVLTADSMFGVEQEDRARRDSSDARSVGMPLDAPLSSAAAGRGSRRGAGA
jgi:hypothetical protein